MYYGFLKMAFLTTNPSPFIINVPELQNVQNSATGASGLSALSNTINDILTFINTANSQININTIGAGTNGSITFTSNINLSNSEITFLGSNLLSSNVLNGPGNFIAFQVSGVEQARLTATGFGIGTTAPALSLDVNGSAVISNSLGIGASNPLLPLDVLGGAIVRGPLYVSSFGAVSSQTGNIIASGDMFANGFFYPSDPLLKRDVLPYISPGLPTPVEFNWRSNGERDIGVLADEVSRLEPACVNRSPAGTLTVDYAKLTVLLCAEVRTLKNQISTLTARLPESPI
jgi:hypothetical protein